MKENHKARMMKSTIIDHFINKIKGIDDRCGVDPWYGTRAVDFGTKV